MASGNREYVPRASFPYTLNPMVIEFGFRGVSIFGVFGNFPRFSRNPYIESWNPSIEPIHRIFEPIHENLGVMFKTAFGRPFGGLLHTSSEESASYANP